VFSERILTYFLRHTIGHYLQLEENRSLQFPAPTPGRKYMLYLHVPFCERLCPYCSFNRFLFNPTRATEYFAYLREEIRMVADLGYDFSSVYIGGGTPTVLINELSQTIDLTKELFHVQEVSCETNPNHLKPEILDALQGRVQRLSVGMQSFDNHLLKQMNRFDKYGSGEENLVRFKEVAPLFPTVNIDMIFNFPSQTEAILRSDIQKIIESGVNQTTFYALMTSPIVARSMARSVGKVDYRREGKFFNILSSELSEAFEPVSAWCFSRKGQKMIDEYIIDHEEYIGLGSGSFSYLGGSLYVNTFSLREYAQLISSGKLSLLKKRSFGLHEQMRYRFLMELFGLKLDKWKFKDNFGRSVERGLWEEMAFMRLAGAFDRNDSQLLTLSPTGRYLMVVMMREFFSSMDKVREQARTALAPDESLELLGDLYRAQNVVHNYD
jgi:coproporphyrinogen III oxidase-like Fe-S oxidoreductase